MGSGWSIHLPMIDEMPRYEYQEPRWVLAIAESLEALLVLGSICAVVFLVLWIREAHEARLARRLGVPIDAGRFPVSHSVLSSPRLWASEQGALFRTTGRKALARVSESEFAKAWRWLAALELARRAHRVERVLRGRGTASVAERRWVDVYLDSAAPRLEKSG